MTESIVSEMTSTIITSYSHAIKELASAVSDNITLFSIATVLLVLAFGVMYVLDYLQVKVSILKNKVTALEHENAILQTKVTHQDAEIWDMSFRNAYQAMLAQQ